MAKVHPIETLVPSSNHTASRRETYTVWMKSLVLHGNGYTIFDSMGKIVYRIDNYNTKCNNVVYLMDIHGKVLFTIRNKRWGVFKCNWEGYRWSDTVEEKKEPFFRVRRSRRNFFSRDPICQLSMSCGEANSGGYKIFGLPSKSSLKALDYEGKLVAEAKQKQSSSGVVLGNDVMTMDIEASVNDHSLFMALVAVYGLMNHKM